MRTIPIVIVFFIILAAAVAGGFYYLREDDGPVTFPRVKDHGGVLLLGKAEQQPRRGAKVMLDITAASKDDEVNRGLERTARLLNLYAAAGVPDRQVHVALVLHGEATRVALTDEAYASRYKAKANPNREIVQALKEAGVEMYVCGQAMHNKKFANDEITPQIAVAVSALTAVINKQGEGYVVMNAP